MAKYLKYGGIQSVSAKNPFGKMSNMTAFFIVLLIGVGFYFWIKRPKRRT